MTQRNPMNDRYTADERSGKTRKSAASAKPKTKAASSVYVASSKNTPKKKGLFSSLTGGGGDKTAKGSSKEESSSSRTPTVTNDMLKSDEEYRKWRRALWIAIAVAVVCTALSFGLQYTGFVGDIVCYVLLGCGYAALAVALVIDLWKIRKIRQRIADSVGSSKGRSKEATAARKAEKAEAKEVEKLEKTFAAEQNAEREQKRAARKEKGLFGLGKKSSESASEKTAQTQTDDSDKPAGN